MFLCDNTQTEKVWEKSETTRAETDGFRLVRNFIVAISVSSHVCFNLILILISMFLI